MTALTALTALAVCAGLWEHGSMVSRPLRLVIFDATDTGPLAIPRIERGTDGTARGTGGLTRWWRIGASLHKLAAHADATLGATSWRDALVWAADVASKTGRPIGELQAWGHGGWGYMGLGGERLTASSIQRSGALGEGVDALRAALVPDALVWLRCCSAFGAADGRAFASALADRLGARTAGHTFIIGAWQSGTHSVRPGEQPSWSEREGVQARSSGSVALTSSPFEPNTVTCLRLGLPEGF